jgi:magnesium chelatase family protein
MKIYSATLHGVTPLKVEIEIDLSSGLPFFQIVGLPDEVLRESKTRVKSAIIQSEFDFPYDSRLVLNLSPSKVKKEGSAFELALAARILISSDQAQIDSTNLSVLFLGELALDGTIRSVDDILALSFAAGEKVDFLVVPFDDVAKVQAHVTCPVVGLKHLRELKGDWLKTALPTVKTCDDQVLENKNEVLYQKLSLLKVSNFWARHLEIAALGRHSYLLCGPPGTGKTFFAESLKNLVSALQGENDSQTKALDAIFGRENGEVPWAAPHHSVTTAGLLGGGGYPKPGAITRAHGGVLFLDELLEFSPAVLDSLREPLERKEVEIFRAGTMMTFPSDVQLIAATNPCRCGYWGFKLRGCRCLPFHRKSYQARMSGPFFDRFEARIFCPAELVDESTVSGTQILKNVRRALDLKLSLGLSAKMNSSPLISEDLKNSIARKVSSRRSLENCCKLAVTLSYLDGLSKPRLHHFEEALKLQKIDELDSLC